MEARQDFLKPHMNNGETWDLSLLSEKQQQGTQKDALGLVYLSTWLWVAGYVTLGMFFQLPHPNILICSLG